jgi:hypothetical protein
MTTRWTLYFVFDGFFLLKVLIKNRMGQKRKVSNARKKVNNNIKNEETKAKPAPGPIYA